MSLWNPDSWESPNIDFAVVDLSAVDGFGEALHVWADAHPLGDRPFLDVFGDEDSALSPCDIADAYNDPDHEHHATVTRILSVGLSGYKGDSSEAASELLEALQTEAKGFRTRE